MTTPSQSQREYLKAESKKIAIFVSVRFRTVLNIKMFKSVNDEFYILMIDIVRIWITGLLPIQCTVIHIPVHLSITSPRTLTIRFFFMQTATKVSEGLCFQSYAQFFFTFYSRSYCLLLIFTEFLYCRKKLMDNSGDAYVFPTFLIPADTGGFAMFIEQLYEPIKR